MTAWSKKQQLAAELVDTLQHERMKRGQQPNFRTAETKHRYPQPTSRTTPLLLCPYCGRKRCVEHGDLPALDPYYNEARRG